jgi:hypothetical protein
MKLPSQIVINPPPYSDQNGNITTPPALVLDSLNLTYTDVPDRKTVNVNISGVPMPITLWAGSDYEAIGDWTQAQAEAKILLLLGDDPAKYLRSLFPRTMEEDPNGPGTQLAKMIKSLGIVMSDSCSCRRHALEMNAKGNDWCSENIDTVVGWLREEAKRRGLPFVDMIGKVMVNRAIKKSRKLLANEPVPENDEDLDNG